MTLSRNQLLILSVMLVTALALSFSIYLTFLSAQTAPRKAITRSWPFEFCISTAKDSYQQGEYIATDLTFRNISNRTIVITWSSFFKSEGKFLPFDVLFIDSNDTYIYQVSEVQARVGAMRSITLEPDAELVATFVWRQHWDKLETLAPAQKGTCYVKGLTRNMRVTIEGATQTIELETPTLSFTIK